MVDKAEVALLRERKGKKMKDQKTLKEEYMDIIAREVWPKSKSMQDYARKTVAYIVELDNGEIADIDKPRIEKDFCFGHGYCGVSTEEEYKAAAAMRDKAASSMDYFLRENLKGIDGWISDLEDERNKVYKRPHYINQTADTKLKAVCVCRAWDSPGYRDAVEMTKDERKAMADGYREVRQAFEKRLHTYLKTYGLSKVNTWTYLGD